MTDYDDPKEEEKWCDECRGRVANYLKTEKVEHGEIGEWPAWHIAPYVSIWAIESKKSPGWVGWWVIAGDLPTDYISAQTIKHPRDAMKAIAERWIEAASLMASGKSPSGFSVGNAKNQAGLAPLLKSRAEILIEWVNDQDIWDYLDEDGTQ